MIHPVADTVEPQVLAMASSDDGARGDPAIAATEIDAGSLGGAFLKAQSFDDQVLSANAAALAWTMTLRTRRPRRVIVVPGLTLLRFGALITSQRDYFDVGAMMYERIPLVGQLLRLLKRAVA